LVVLIGNLQSTRLARREAAPSSIRNHNRIVDEMSGLSTGWRRRELNRHRSLDYNELVRHEAFAMPLQRGDVQGYDFNRMVVEFTMLNQSKVILCAISTAAMDDLEGRRDVKPEQRVDQFMKLRDIIEERAPRKFFEEQAQADRPVVLRSNDFFR
jgi:Protein of unknown function (DUF1488)